MGLFYALKIVNGNINSKTSSPWKLEDVPALWKSATEDALLQLQ